jgi:hypothetical protein
MKARDKFPSTEKYVFLWSKMHSTGKHKIRLVSLKKLRFKHANLSIIRRSLARHLVL